MLEKLFVPAPPSASLCSMCFAVSAKLLSPKIPSLKMLLCELVSSIKLKLCKVKLSLGKLKLVKVKLAKLCSAKLSAKFLGKLSKLVLSKLSAESVFYRSSFRSWCCAILGCSAAIIPTKKLVLLELDPKEARH